MQGTKPRSHEQRTGYSQKKKKKNPLQIWHLSLQVEIPAAAAWFAEIPRACSPPVAQDDLQPFGKIQEIWVCSQTCHHLSGASAPIQARISCTETKITFSKASCGETLQQNPQNEVCRVKLTLSIRAAPLPGCTICYKLFAERTERLFKASAFHAALCRYLLFKSPFSQLFDLSRGSQLLRMLRLSRNNPKIQ